jgi:RNA 3'-terminal phosphate cyclase (ATP)
MIEIASDEVTEIFSAFGKLGVTAETVASIAVSEAREYLASRAAAGEHLADQLLLPLALAGSGSFTATKINMHARTNMAVISQFLPVQFETRKEDGFISVWVAGGTGNASDNVTSCACRAWISTRSSLLKGRFNVLPAGARLPSK